MQFNVGHLTDIGRKRQQNQDSLVVHPELGLFVVADGMGGHKGGETASAIAVETIPGVVRAEEQNPNWDPRATVTKAIEAANAAIQKRGHSEPQLQGMGTTCVTMLFKDDVLTVGHVGDSRCYYLRAEAVWQVTRDHSLVQEKLRAGLITREQMKTDRMKNVITRSVGFETDVDVDVYEMSVQPGDVFLICSDGLSGLMEDTQMHAIVRSELLERNDMKAAVERLIRVANENGGDDNISAVVVQILGKS